MPFLVIAFCFGLAGGVIGRIKGSSFLLWFLISAIPPFIGLVAAVLYRNEYDEPHRRCPTCRRSCRCTTPCARAAGPSSRRRIRLPGRREHAHLRGAPRSGIRTILPRHEQGGGFAAEGYARVTGKPGVVMATSGPGALNLVTGLADAKMDSLPIIAITGQVPTKVIGTDAFQETPMVEVCRAITKHHYLVQDARDIARVVKEAFHIASTGRPGPVLIDVPKDVQNTLVPDPDYDVAMDLPGYRLPPPPTPEKIRQVAEAIKASRRPIIYCGGGTVASDAAEELREFADKTGIPVAMTLQGLGAIPSDHYLSLDMLGMHGTVYANYAINEADLLLALGVRFDDRVTGKLSEFAKHGQIVHVDIDASEINKNKAAHIAVNTDVKATLEVINPVVEAGDYRDWHQQIDAWRESRPDDLRPSATTRSCRSTSSTSSRS